jgi:mannan endo-1,4-beta-mannosidase
VAESFHVPLNTDQPHTLSRTPWVLWTVWGQALTYDNVGEPRHKNTPADVKRTYASPLVITAEKWRSLRSLPHGPLG